MAVFELCKIYDESRLQLGENQIKAIVFAWMGWNWLIEYVHRKKKQEKNEEKAPPSEDANVSPSSDGTCRALSRSLLLPTWSRLQITGQDAD